MTKDFQDIADNIQNLINTTCSNHDEMPIDFVCQNENCKQNQLCCEKCVSELHTSHTIRNIQDLIQKNIQKHQIIKKNQNSHQDISNCIQFIESSNKLDLLCNNIRESFHNHMNEIQSSIQSFMQTKKQELIYLQNNDNFEHSKIVQNFSKDKTIFHEQVTKQFHIETTLDSLQSTYNRGISLHENFQFLDQSLELHLKKMQDEIEHSLQYVQKKKSLYFFKDIFKANQQQTQIQPVIEKETIQTLLDAGLAVLKTSDPYVKADLTHYFVKKWFNKEIQVIANESILNHNEQIQNIDFELEAPQKPARPDSSFFSTKTFSPKSIQFQVHSIAHAESYAIDLMWDVMVRFVKMNLPREFYDDWMKVAGEEADHFYSWANRLTQLGTKYGGMPGHDGLWDAAQATSHDLYQRIALVNLVHEARGLDTCLLTRKKFETVKDKESLSILEKNSNQEIVHVGFGVKWFKYLCEKDGFNAVSKFHEVVRGAYNGYLTPPFNTEMREKAGLTEEWYLPLSQNR